MRNACLAVVALAVVAPSGARAATTKPCPTVMIVLDRSASMDETPSGLSSGPTKMELAKKAIIGLLQADGTRMPFGFTTFSNGGGCFTGIDILTEPVNGKFREIITQVQGVMSNQSTNTGEAVAKVAADSAMHDPNRPGSYILLITDGEPNCPDPATARDPAYTVGQIKAAADGGVKTFVIGFGHLPGTAQQAMNMMADAGGVPCTDPTCGARRFYAAESETALNMAIDAVSKQIVGEFGALCDDSCYSNPCPTGSVCVWGVCADDPCAGVTCAAGDYCLTDGMAPGKCVTACPAKCPDGESCQMGTCVVDPCVTASCVPPQVCVNGGCVPNPCGAFSCDSNYVCKDGQCVDDPCHYVHCPDNHTCVSGTGSCASVQAATTTGGTSGAVPRAKASGCSLGSDGAPGAAVLLLLLALGARLRRKKEIRS